MWTFFFRTIVLFMLNISISLFSPYLRECENGLLGSPIWSYFSDIILMQNSNGNMKLKKKKKSVQIRRKGSQSQSQNQTRSLRGGNPCFQNAERNNNNDVIQIDFVWLCQIKFSNSYLCFLYIFFMESQISKLGTWWKFSEVWRKQGKWCV